VSEQESIVAPEGGQPVLNGAPVDDVVMRKAVERARAQSAVLRAQSGELKSELVLDRLQYPDGSRRTPPEQHFRNELRHAQHGRRLAEQALDHYLGELSRLRAELEESLGQQAVLAEQVATAERLNEETAAELAHTNAELVAMNKELQDMADRSTDRGL